MNAYACEKCGSAMALAETLCSRCGAPAPKARLEALALDKAGQAYERGQTAAAVGQLERALGGDLEAAERLPALRKLALWREKLSVESRSPLLLDAALGALKQALTLNDADELSHQLFIALHARMGNLAMASNFYQQRLNANPEDAMAAKQLKVIRLSADFLTSAPPKLNLPPPPAWERWLKPSPLKLGFAALSLALSFMMMLFSWGKDATSVATLMEGEADFSSVLNQFNDPWVWGFQAAFFALYLVAMWRNR